MHRLDFFQIQIIIKETSNKLNNNIKVNIYRQSEKFQKTKNGPKDFLEPLL